MRVTRSKQLLLAKYVQITHKIWLTSAVLKTNDVHVDYNVKSQLPVSQKSYTIRRVLEEKHFY